MFGELIREFVRDQPDVTVVGDVNDPTQLRSAMYATRANCVIVASSDGQLPPDCQDLMDDYASVKLVLLVEEGRDGFVWHFEPQRASAGVMTRQGLLSAIGAG